MSVVSIDFSELFLLILCDKFALSILLDPNKACVNDVFCELACGGCCSWADPP